MSDLDLRNLYENVRRGDEYVAPKKVTDLYVEVLGNIDPNTLNDPDGPKLVTFKDVKDMDSENMLNFPDVSEETYNMVMTQRSHVIATWIKGLCGYADEANEVSNNVMGMLDRWCDWEKLSNYINKGVKNKNKLESYLKGSFNLRDAIDSQLLLIKKDKSTVTIDDVYTTLFAYAFAESTVSVGKGELILTLFTDAKKGSVGDLMYLKDIDGGSGIRTDNIQVEVKVGKGRAVSARGGMFKPANQALEDAVVNNLDLNTNDFVDLLIKNVDPALEKLSPYSRCAELPGLLKSASQGKKDDKLMKVRHDLTLATLLWSYANPKQEGKGFSHLLVVYQAGKKASTAKNPDPEKDQYTYGRPMEGTLENAESIDCTSLKNIYDAMQREILVMTRGGAAEGGKALDGEGVYVLYTGSNTEVAYQAMASTLGPSRDLLSPEQQKIYDLGYKEAQQGK